MDAFCIDYFERFVKRKVSIFLTTLLQKTATLSTISIGELKHLISQKNKSSEILALVVNETNFGKENSWAFLNFLKKVKIL